VCFSHRSEQEKDKERFGKEKGTGPLEKTKGHDNFTKGRNRTGAKQFMSLNESPQRKKDRSICAAWGKGDRGMFEVAGTKEVRNICENLKEKGIRGSEGSLARVAK